MRMIETSILENESTKIIMSSDDIISFFLLPEYAPLAFCKNKIGKILLSINNIISKHDVR